MAISVKPKAPFHVIDLSEEVEYRRAIDAKYKKEKERAALKIKEGSNSEVNVTSKPKQTNKNALKNAAEDWSRELDKRIYIDGVRLDVLMLENNIRPFVLSDTERNQQILALVWNKILLKKIPEEDKPAYTSAFAKNLHQSGLFHELETIVLANVNPSKYFIQFQSQTRAPEYYFKTEENLITLTEVEQIDAIDRMTQDNYPVQMENPNNKIYVELVEEHTFALNTLGEIDIEKTKATANFYIIDAVDILLEDRFSRKPELKKEWDTKIERILFEYINLYITDNPALSHAQNNLLTYLILETKKPNMFSIFKGDEKIKLQNEALLKYVKTSDHKHGCINLIMQNIEKYINRDPEYFVRLIDALKLIGKGNELAMQVLSTVMPLPENGKELNAIINDPDRLRDIHSLLMQQIDKKAVATPKPDKS